jgi:hypothetical protein
VQQLDETACRQLVERLLAACSGLTPVVWDNRLNAAEAQASWQALMHGRTIELGSLLADAADRQRRLPVVPLLVERDGDYLLLPADDFTLQPATNCSSPARWPRSANWN